MKDYGLLYSEPLGRGNALLAAVGGADTRSTTGARPYKALSKSFKFWFSVVLQINSIRRLVVEKTEKDVKRTRISSEFLVRFACGLLSTPTYSAKRTK